MFLSLFISNLLTLPIFSFILGILASIAKFRMNLPRKVNSVLTFFLLFSIGVKGGASLVENANSGIFFILGLLVVWGLLQPFLSFLILRKFTKIDTATAAAVAACFGSISVMTYVAGTTFLENIHVKFDGFVVAALAVMEVPAIISGLLISQFFNAASGASKKNLISEALFNKSILMILAGMLLGVLSTTFKWDHAPAILLAFFTPCLCFFLFTMGFVVGKHRDHLKQFSLSLGLFGLYMPLLGGAFGICLSYFLGLDAGTGTLIAILTASASYIAVPAAMRVALPEAQEAVYLPLSLGITFPFNVTLGIPIYYHIASKFLI